ncbi:MAG: hypothetical protein IKS55_07810 [Oscillospiraceae bacterium]|nr:hypothetical protein [Oscillospiraceae bacterium]
MEKRVISFLLMLLLIIQIVPAFAAGAVQLTVPSELSIDGKTSYDLTISEYLDLLAKVHEAIQTELDDMSLGFQHIESIEPDDGCTVFTVTVNSSTLTNEEKAAENRMYEMRDQMAAYLAEENKGIRVEYKNKKGDLISSSDVGMTSLLLLEETQANPYKSGSTSSSVPQTKVVPTPTPTPTPTKSEATYSYILNTNTKKFHYPDCKSVKQMKEKNKSYYDGTRSEIIAMGYSPCGNCHP